MSRKNVENKKKIFFDFLGYRGPRPQPLGGPNFWGSKRKFKNRHGGATYIPPKYSQPKNQSNSPNRLGCRGGCYTFQVLHIL